jgi:hypothetical protein
MKPMKQRRERVAEIQDDRLKNVSPEHHQRSELADEPEDGGDDQVGGKIVELRHDIPPGRLVVDGITFDDEQLVELLIDVGTGQRRGRRGWKFAANFAGCCPKPGRNTSKRREHQKPQQQVQIWICGTTGVLRWR